MLSAHHLLIFVVYNLITMKRRFVFMADEFNNQNNGNNQNYAQSANNDMQVQMAVDNAMAEKKRRKRKNA